MLLKRYSKSENPGHAERLSVPSGWNYYGIVRFCSRWTGERIYGIIFGLLFYMACISAVAYTLWGILLKYNPISRVAVFGFMNPVFGVILSAMVLGEKEQAQASKCGCPDTGMHWYICGKL